MRIIKKLLAAVKPGPSSRNTLTRSIPRHYTAWQKSQMELLALFATPHQTTVPTWSQSLADLKTVLA